METQETKEQKSKGRGFVEHVIKKLGADNAFGAALRRADNPATEVQAWEHLASWCDLEDERKRLAFGTIGAALARAKPEHDGTLGIGQAIASCYETDHERGNQSDAAKARLRRLLSCDSLPEACRILRPLLSLIASKGRSLNYGRLLDDLLWFSVERTRPRWANDFYGRRDDS